MNWHKVPFNCEKGHKAQILEVCVSADGTFAILGVCIICGQDVQRAFSMVTAISTCAVEDKKDEEDPDISLLRNFQSTVCH